MKKITKYIVQGLPWPFSKKNKERSLGPDRLDVVLALFMAVWLMFSLVWLSNLMGRESRGHAKAIDRIGMPLAYLLLLSLPIAAQAQSHALMLGDKVPGVSISHIRNYQPGTAKLSDFKGKLLILDFWATWCSPCVAMIPKMDSLQKEFGDKIFFLPVTYQSAKDVDPFLAKLQKRKAFNLPEVVADTVLHKLFPHVLLPHYVWIDADGTVAAITGYQEVTAVNISAVLAKSQRSITAKQDVAIPFDKSRPLLSDNNGDEKALLYHSVFTRFTEGLGSGIQIFRTDSISGKKITARNLPLLWLYRTAFTKEGYFGTNRMILEVKDPAKLTSTLKGREYHEWMLAGNAYCYELIVPPALSARVYEFMKADLERIFYQYEALTVQRKLPCLALVRSGDEKFRANGTQPAFKIDALGLSMKSMPLNALLIQLNQVYMQRSALPVIDRTGFTGLADLELSADMSSIASLNTALAAYGLALQETEQEMPILLIRDRKPVNSN